MSYISGGLEVGATTRTYVLPASLPTRDCTQCQYPQLHRAVICPNCGAFWSVPGRQYAAIWDSTHNTFVQFFAALAPITWGLYSAVGAGTAKWFFLVASIALWTKWRGGWVILSTEAAKGHPEEPLRNYMVGLNKWKASYIDAIGLIYIGVFITAVFARSAELSIAVVALAGVRLAVGAFQYLQYRGKWSKSWRWFKSGQA